MTHPVAIQLYTVRDQLKENYEGVVRQMAAMGYLGVETAGFPEGTTAAQAKALFDELGLTVVSAHSPLPLEDKKESALADVQTLGSPYLTLGGLSATEYFQSLDGIYRACDRLNQASEVCQSAGVMLLYHNHWWECTPVEGRLPYQVMLERLDPQVGFEIDTYWAKTAGVDPVQMIREIGSRAPLLHIKDGPARQGEKHQPLGAGVMDFAPIVAAADQVKWLIVEQDTTASGDMLGDVQQSYTFITQKGLAHGRK